MSAAKQASKKILHQASRMLDKVPKPSPNKAIDNADEFNLLDLSVPDSAVLENGNDADPAIQMHGAPPPLTALPLVEIADNGDVVIDFGPPPSHLDLPRILQDFIDQELTHWSVKYESDSEFRDKIDTYIYNWTRALEAVKAGAPPEELDKLYDKLGTMLADAFGMIDPHTRDWTQEVKDSCAKGGKLYSRGTVWAFGLTNLPGAASAAFRILGQAAVGLGAPPEVAVAASNIATFAHVIVQIPVTIYAAQENARIQSEGVQGARRESPSVVPNEQSTTVVKLDRTPGELRPVIDVQEDRNDLEFVSKLIDSGTKAELGGAIALFYGKILEAKGKLQNKLSDATTSLGKLLQQQNQEQLNDTEEVKLNDIEERLVDQTVPPLERVALLSKIADGRAVLTNIERQKVNRRLQQIKLWEFLVDELEAARQFLPEQPVAKKTFNSDLEDSIESQPSEYKTPEGTEVPSLIPPFDEPPRPTRSAALRKAHWTVASEQMVIFQKRALNVATNQNYSRDRRSGGFVLYTLGQLTIHLAEQIVGDTNPASDAWQLAMSLALPIAYAYFHPKATAADFENKLATQWKIVAMTGTGNFVDEEGGVVPQRLDGAVIGLLRTRMLTAGSLFHQDRQVYAQAILGWIVVAELDVNKAKPVELHVPKRNHDGKEVKDQNGDVVMERRSLPCTYLSLATEFLQLSRSEDRKRFIDEVAKQRGANPEVRLSMHSNLRRFEDNEVWIKYAKAMDVMSLLKSGPPTGDELMSKAIELLTAVAPFDADIGELAKTFGNLPTPEARKRFVDRHRREGIPSAEDEAEMKQALTSYEKMREPGLPAGFARILEGSLRAALKKKGGGQGLHKLEDAEMDKMLFDLMAKIEQRSEAGTLQIAQKIGQLYPKIALGTGGFLLLKAIFALVAQAMILNDEINGTDKLAAQVFGTKIAGDVISLLSLVFSVALTNHAYFLFIYRKNWWRQLTSGTLSVVNVPAASLRKSLIQELLASVLDEEWRVETITGYDLLAGDPIPPADCPPELKFIRRVKLPEAAGDQILRTIDISAQPWVDILSYFNTKHGSLVFMTEEALEEAAKQDLAELKRYLEEPGTEATGALPERTEFALKLPHGNPSIDNAMSSLPPTPRPHVQTPPTTPRNLHPEAPNGSPWQPTAPDAQGGPLNTPDRTPTSRVKSKRLAKGQSEAPINNAPKSRNRSSTVNQPKQPNQPNQPNQPSVIYAKNAFADPFENDLPVGPDKDDSTVENVENRPPEDKLQVVRPQPTAPSSVLQGLVWLPFEGEESLFVAKTGKYHYFSHSPIGTDAVRAYPITNDPQHILHFTEPSPGFAASNMLQMRISRNTAWRALAGPIAFAQFCTKWKVTSAPVQLVDPEFSHLALFSQQMTLDHPDSGWSPLTSESGTYMIGTEHPLQYQAVPPALPNGAPFVLQYRGRFGQMPVLKAAMLTVDEHGVYVAVDPAAREHFSLETTVAEDALEKFMADAARDYTIESFSILRHVPAAKKDQRFLEIAKETDFARTKSGGIAISFLENGKTLPEAMLWIKAACHELEQLKSYLFMKNSKDDEQLRRSILQSVQEIDQLLDTLRKEYTQAVIMQR